MAKKGYTEPKLHDCNGDLKKEWYVSFRYTNPITGERKPFPHRMGLNYLHTKKERYEEAEAIKGLLNDALSDGWNPFVEDYKAFLLRTIPDPVQKPVFDYSQLLLPAALEFAAEKINKGLELKTIQGYVGVRRFAIAAAKKLQIDQLPVCEIKRKHIKLILDQMAEDRQAEYDDEKASKKIKGKKFSGNSYNKYKRYLSAHFTELEQYDAVEYNPCEKISDREEITTNIHRQATAEEETQIKDYLKKVNLRFFIYLAVETLAGLRPKEIFGLRIADINKTTQCFEVHATDGRSKTKTARMVPIPNTLMKYIAMLKLDKHPVTHHIFSHDFKPGEKRQHRQRATELWQELVKDEMGINVTLYSFKGLGGERKRQAGIDKNAVQRQFGHSKGQMTDIYLPNEEERIRREIIDGTPDW